MSVESPSVWQPVSLGTGAIIALVIPLVASVMLLGERAVTLDRVRVIDQAMLTTLITSMAEDGFTEAELEAVRSATEVLGAPSVMESRIGVVLTQDGSVVSTNISGVDSSALNDELASVPENLVDRVSISPSVELVFVLPHRADDGVWPPRAVVKGLLVGKPDVWRDFLSKSMMMFMILVFLLAVHWGFVEMRKLSVERRLAESERERDHIERALKKAESDRDEVMSRLEAAEQQREVLEQDSEELIGLADSEIEELKSERNRLNEKVQAYESLFQSVDQQCEASEPKDKREIRRALEAAFGMKWHRSAVKEFISLKSHGGAELKSAREVLMRVALGQYQENSGDRIKVATKPSVVLLHNAHRQQGKVYWQGDLDIPFVVHACGGGDAHLSGVKTAKARIRSG